MSYLDLKVGELKKQGVYRKLPINDGPCEAIIKLNGK